MLVHTTHKMMLITKLKSVVLPPNIKLKKFSKICLHSTLTKQERCYDVMLSRQEGSTMCHLANARYVISPARGDIGQLFLSFIGLVCSDWIDN